MPSIFNEDEGRLVCIPLEVTFTQLSGLGAAYVMVLSCPVRVTNLSFKSTLSTEVQVFLENHKDSTAYKNPWIKLASNDTFELQSNMPPATYLPSGTKIWLKPVGADPASGKVSIYYWGS